MVAQSGFEPLISNLWGSRVNQTSLPRNLEIENHSLEKQSSKGEIKSLTDNFRAIVHVNHNIISSRHQPAMHKFTSSLIYYFLLSSLHLNYQDAFICNLTNDFILN